MKVDAQGPKERKIAVGLVRCSTDMQEHSIEDQETEIRAWAKETNHDLVMMFRDEGVSGSELNRPGIRALFAFLESSERTGTLVCWHRSRLARPEDPRQGIVLELKIEELGWSLHFLKGTPASGNVLVDAMMGLVEHHKNGQYLKDLSADVLRTQLHRITAGDVPGGKVPYGYVKVVTESNGQERTILRTTKHRKLKEERVRWAPGDEAEVRVVRRIFDEYVQARDGFAEIARKLNDDEIPSPNNARWTAATIREILTNPHYVGDLIWNKETSSRFFRISGGRVLAQDRTHASRAKRGSRTNYKKNNPADWIRIENHHEGLVDRSIFERAREIMTKRGAGHGRSRGQRPLHPLSGLVFCGTCGKPMYGRNTKAREHHYRKYFCSSYERSRDCAPNAIHADQLESAALFVLKEACVPKDRPIDTLRETFADIIRRNASKDVPDVDRAAMKRERDDLATKIAKAVDNLGVVGPDIAQRLAGQIGAWERRRAELDLELSRDLGREETRRLHALKAEETADNLIALLQDLARLTRESSPQERRELFERTVKRIDVRFESVNPLGGGTRQRHVPIGATVKTNDLLGVAQQVGCTKNELLG